MEIKKKNSKKIKKNNIVDKKVAKTAKKAKTKIVEPPVKAAEETIKMPMLPEKPTKPQEPKKDERVSQYTMEGKYLRTFPSIKDAVDAMEISSQTIKDYINGKRYQTGGYLWGYADDSLETRKLRR
jgi:hypothetical protein